MPESFTKGQPIAQLQGKELKVQGHTASSNNTEVIDVVQRLPALDAKDGG